MMKKRGVGLANAGKAKRGAAVTDMVFYIVVAIIILAIFGFAYLYFSGKLQSAGEYIKNMFRNLLGG